MEKARTLMVDRILLQLLFLVSLAGNLFWMNKQSDNKDRFTKLQNEKIP